MSRRRLHEIDWLCDPGPRIQRLIASGTGDLTQREIGHELNLSLNTVKSHTRSIFRKLGVSGQEQAVARPASSS